MKFSGLEDILKYKYGDGEDPKKIKRRRMWANIFYGSAALLLICAIVLNVLYANGVFNETDKPVGNIDVEPWQTPEIQQNIQFSVVDRSSTVREMKVDEVRINQPSIYGHEMLFSAGTGALESSVLTNLYLFNAVDGTAKKVTQSKMSGGEIFETYLSENWIVWVDTDHKGKNVIYKMNRVEIDGIKANTVSEVRETENHMPRMGLYGDYLVWMEQVSDNEDKLYFIDLTSDENMAIKLFESTNYAVSTPYIYKNTVIWADHDPENENLSAIYSLVFEDLGENDTLDEETFEEEEEEDSGEIEPQVFSTGTYVHKPICNNDIYVWIDKNNAPDSTLYYAYRSGAHEPVSFWDNVTQYSLGDDFIVFVSNQIVYAYYYKSDVLLQVSESGSSAILPQAFGTLIVWEDKTSTSGSDVFKYNIMG